MISGQLSVLSFQFRGLSSHFSGLGGPELRERFPNSAETIRFSGVDSFYYGEKWEITGKRGREIFSGGGEAD